MNLNQQIAPKGEVDMLIEYENGAMEFRSFHNAVLQTGRQALVNVLTKNIGDTFDFFINRMLFGDGGVDGTKPRLINTNRTGLFGTVRVNKPVVAVIDPNNTTQAVFTSVIAFDEGVGHTLNEMALQLNSGDLYSMVTFPNLTKTSAMQITWNWRLTFV